MKYDSLETKKRFGTQVEAYNKYRSEYPKEFYDLIFQLNKRKSKKILDIGCGTGKSTENLARGEVEVFGIDHDPRMLSQAIKNSKDRKLGINYLKGEAESLPFEDNSFDIITIGNAFHWFANEESIKDIKRVLRPGGLIFIYWKQIDDDDIKLRNQIFKKFNPKYRCSSKLMTLKQCRELFGHEFQRTRHIIKKYSFHYDLESAIGRLKTIGSYFNLNSKQKLEFENVAKKVFEKYLNNKKSIDFLPTTHVYYTYKSNNKEK